jgi:transposase
MHEQTDPSDLTDEAWQRITELIPAAQSGRRPRTWCMRAVLKAIFSGTKGGMQWRRWPTDCPKWQSVSHDVRTWKRAGVWGRIHDTVRARVRAQEAQHQPPTAGCRENQAVKTTEVGGPERGCDHGKQVQGRKRHVLVDTRGW